MSIIVGLFGGLFVAACAIFAEWNLRELDRLRRIDIVLRSKPGEPPPELSVWDPWIQLWRTVQVLAIGVILVVAGASLALKGQ